MSELRALVSTARALRAARTPFVSATVVRVQGSAYRRPGARMIATEREWLAGSISAGCLERDVLQKGFWRTRQQAAVCVRYAEAEDALEEARGAGCQGVIDYLIERWDPAQPLAAADVWSALEHCLVNEQSGVLLTVVASQRPGIAPGQRAFACAGDFQSSVEDAGVCAQLKAAAEQALREPGPARLIELSTQHGALELLVERIEPPPHLFIFGSAHDVTPVLQLGQQLGWTVSIWAGQPRFSARERLRAADNYHAGLLGDAVHQLERAACPLALIMGHDLAQDQEVLAALLSRSLRYLGVLGPRRRTQQMLSRLQAAGTAVSDATLAVLHGPAGLAIGAQTPAEIALSIVAQMQEALTRPARAAPPHP